MIAFSHFQNRQRCQHIVFSAVAAESFGVLVAHDGEGVHDVGRVIQPQAVQPEKQRVERSQAGAVYGVQVSRSAQTAVTPGLLHRHSPGRAQMAPYRVRCRSVPAPRKLAEANFLTITIELLRLT